MSYDQNIHVIFINVENGEPFGETSIAANQLPPSFDDNNTLQIGHEQWQVIEATPSQASDFIASKELVLHLKKISTPLPPSNILYSLPTISNEIPMLVQEAPFSSFTLFLHEDEWRQKEFIHPRKLALVGEEVDEIKEIWMNFSKEIDDDHRAFKNIHVRKTIGLPGLYISLEQLMAVLQVSEPGSISFQGHEGYVENGFSLETTNSKYYGIVENGVVKQLGVIEENDSTMREVNKLIRVFSLSFVNWVQCLIIPA
ncbi:hypothetical protein LX64_04660 [Chitinophaga skermanii]|uniref:Uncharacterized protein n=1 Tax=Chitinophaga skermanii TaxID=331697 RepID=A0A327Q2I4_9BACT|nr:hypothetical protein [Chitinophaga skermanii]RAI98675.1 hypothetical protein LX64_04660 [Chitinophaga skermanii]